MQERAKIFFMGCLNNVFVFFGIQIVLTPPTQNDMLHVEPGVGGRRNGWRTAEIASENEDNYEHTWDFGSILLSHKAFLKTRSNEAAQKTRVVFV